MKKMSLHAWLLLSAVSLTPAAARTACEADIPEPVPVRRIYPNL